jgi:catechol 2,3-dioxygenase-like lactoylglutathione lyase family enzyme
MKMKSILSGLIVVCAACMSLAASYSQASNKPTQEPPMAIVSVRYIVDDVDTAIEFYTKLTELASVRFLIDHARAAVAFYTIHLGFPIALADGAIGITNGRARALVAAVVGLISLVVGGLALARSAGHIGAGNGRAGAVVALALGLIGMILSVAHLGSSTGGFGSGSGRAGAIVALVLGLIGMNLGGMALSRSRRSRSAA